MKIHFHGASVTAQMRPFGYFEALQSLWGVRNPDRLVEFSRSSFGASHFDNAGFHFISEVLVHQPDICVLEWATTSAKRFSPDKCDAVTAFLLDNNILPVWLIFPRQDDLSSTRATINDAAEAAKRWGVPLINIVADFPNGSWQTLLRDVVHTNEIGARLYAASIVFNIERLLNLNLESFAVKGAAADLMRASIGGVPNNYSMDNLPKGFALIVDSCNIDVRHYGGPAEIVVEGIVGPYSPVILSEIKDADGRCVIKQRVNLLDPWCHYERRMVNTLLKAALEPGTYTFVVSVLDADPMLEVVLRKPVDASNIHPRRLRNLRLSLLNSELIK